MKRLGAPRPGPSGDGTPRLATRAELLALFERLMAEAASAAHPVSLSLANLDHFKSVNLDHGPMAGDLVLDEVAALFVRAAHAQRAVARIGGDLFTILERADLASARGRAEKLRREIARASFSNGIRLTASFGIAAATEAVPFDGLLRAAESCLYAAKAKGRDCVVDSDEFTAMVERSANDAEIADHENKLRVLTDRLSHAVQLRSRRIAGQLRVEADRDGLTGLFNRRYFDRRLAREIEAAHKRSRRLAISLLDLDHFGNVNRTYGYPAGDAALRALAEILQESVRPVDWAARYGGEEFCVVLPDTTADEALLVAERIRAALACRLMRSHDGRTFGITVSQGVVALGPEDRNSTDLIQRAGDVLQQAKKAGRNRVAW